MIKDKDGKPLSRSEAEGIMKNRSSVTVSIFAALLALCALIGNQNSSRILNNTLMITDLWGFYQAKSIKQTIAEGQLEDALAAKNENKALELKRKIDRYESDPVSNEGKKELMAIAKEHERHRDTALRKDPWFDYAEALLQIGIVLASVAIITSSGGLLACSVAAGLFGTLATVNGYLLFY